MGYCKHCGKEILPGEIHKCKKESPIKRFFSWLLDRSGIENPFRNKKEIYERGQKIAPDNIALDAGEVPVKQYNIGILRSRLRFQRSEGRLQITNKRVLFRATGYSPAGKTTYQHAFSLDKIDGVEIHKDRRFRVPDFLFALWWDGMSYAIFAFIMSLIKSGLGMEGFGQIVLSVLTVAFGIGALVHFFMEKQKFFKKLIITGIARGGILAVIGTIAAAVFEATDIVAFLALFPAFILLLVYLLLTILYYVSTFLTVIKPNLMIEIKTSSGSPGIQIKHKEISFIWHKSEKFSGFTEILPWEDTDIAIQEVATIIDDIKTLGDMGVEKWKQD